MCGANIDPKRPTEEQKERRLFLQFVGKISEVKKYTIMKLPVEVILARKYRSDDVRG